MPIIKSAKKALRRDKRRAIVNKKIKDKVKATLKKVVRILIKKFKRNF